MFCNARQPHWVVLSSAWSGCLHTGPQGHLSQRKFRMPSTGIPAQLNCDLSFVFMEGFLFQRHADIDGRNPEKGFCLRSGEPPLGYLGNLHLLLPCVDALLQPPVFLLGPHVLSDAGCLVLGNLAAQTLVESLLPATLLWRHQQRCGASAERENACETDSWRTSSALCSFSSKLCSFCLRLLMSPLSSLDSVDTLCSFSC